MNWDKLEVICREGNVGNGNQDKSQFHGFQKANYCLNIIHENFCRDGLRDSRELQIFKLITSQSCLVSGKRLYRRRL